MTASIRTIAKIAQTSVSSVSRVLNNSGYVSPEVRHRVETAIKDLNYAPSKGARMLRGEASRMIGLMLPSIDVPFFGILANTIERELFERGYHTLICSSAENEEHEARYVAMLRAQRVEGVIVASAYGGTAHLRPLVDSGIPIIAIDRELVGISDDVFMADHAEGGRIMTRHLIGLGHRQVAVVGAPGHSQPIQLRLEGIRAVLRNRIIRRQSKQSARSIVLPPPMLWRGTFSNNDPKSPRSSAPLISRPLRPSMPSGIAAAPFRPTARSLASTIYPKRVMSCPG